MPRTLKDDVEKIVGSLARLNAHEGDARTVAVLAHSKVTLEEAEYDNWNGGISGYAVHLELPLHLFAQIAHEQKEIEESLKLRAGNLARLYENEYICGFIIFAELPENDDWRDKAKAWVRGEGVNNQGRACSKNVAPFTCDGLLFRSRPEIHLYRALRKLGVSFAPLPVFVRGGETYRRIEPDFFIVKDGVVLVVEVDGDTVHQESPREAHDRLTMLIHEGVHVERVNAKQCETPELAKECAAEMLRVIEKLKTNK